MLDIDPTRFPSFPAQGRDCGTCTLCCKVFDVPALAKPAGSWCAHCKPGRGCGIWETRPAHCRAFHCLWMTENWLGPEWKPEIAKFVLTLDPVSRYLLVQLDPGQPQAWRREPYRSQLRSWAAAAAREKRRVVVFLNRRATVILPDREVDLGVFAPGDRLVSRERQTADGLMIEVEKVREAG